MANKRNIFEEVGSDTKITSASAGAIARAGSGDRHWVRLWLWSLVGLIIVMITVGGLTRLTDSGLSITEWDPVMGAIPPLNAAAWQAAFAAYQTTAEFAVQNAAMSLAEFKVIFWWEWGHRQLGRFIGLTWALGFALLFFTGKLPKARRLSLFAIGPFIGLQGVIGWLMVHSGLMVCGLMWPPIGLWRISGRLLRFWGIFTGVCRYFPALRRSCCRRAARGSASCLACPPA
jgi:cytochrome c oxidase assembly protein subunit 15